MLKLVWSLAGVLGLRRYLEDYFLNKLSETFGSQEPLSTSFADAYTPPAEGIKDIPAQGTDSGILAELRRTGVVSIPPGIYDFPVEGFCLRAGAYSPNKGDGYLAAPLKGSRAAVISAVLSGSSKHPEVSQQAVQTLLWAVESGVRYTALKGDARIAADAILSKEHKNNLGQSFWDAVPAALQNLITDEALKRLPSDMNNLLVTYRTLKTRIESGSTYSELERLAVLFNAPVSVGGSVAAGTWSAIPGGYYARVFPSGYTSARFQVYVPPNASPVNFSFGDFIMVPADTSRQRLGFRPAPDDADHLSWSDGPDIEIVFKEGERLSNPDVIEALKKLAEILGADKVEVTSGDRTRAEQERLINDKKTTTSYEKTPHGEHQGYIAADAKFYKDGKQINPDTVADMAGGLSDIGGIGYYKDFTHIDLRKRLEGDIPTTWGKGGNK
ncbi:MAG: hypothetical protein QME32_05600 [Endomicrobiia bacterium]|nr:hypothetical protein [Endomicrobiia bacterium]